MKVKTYTFHNLYIGDNTSLNRYGIAISKPERVGMSKVMHRRLTRTKWGIEEGRRQEVWLLEVNTGRASIML